MHDKVKTLLACGVEPSKIAIILDISEAELNAKFAKELATAEAEANAKVARSLYKMATSGKHPQASIFWMKSRAKWKEQVDLSVETEITGFRVITEED